ncbi:MAG: C10 family peptidase [Kiritimatiellae bacterium]|nr:C10 family peptidase [Kiritimatiellia bacterium]
MKRNVLLSVAAAMFAAMPAFGDAVTGDDAKGAVAGWVSLREALGDEIDAEPESVATYQGQDGKGEFHVVSLKGGGYVITSGDTEITPILGYSKTGTFDADENSPQWALLTADVAARAAELEGEGPASSGPRPRLSAALPSSASASEWARLMSAGKSGGKRLQAKMASAPTDLRVDSFVQSKWSQNTARSGNGYTHHYYDYYTPNNYPCGCVATAFAQTMRYFEFPKTSVTAKTFTCKVDGTDTDLTMQGGTYDWAHMPYVPSSVPYDWDNVIGIAKLTSDAGISICMNYKSSGSGSKSLCVGDSLVSTFGYSNAIADYESGGVRGDKLKKNIIPSLDAKLPVILGIQGKPTGSATSDAGHSILTDGYGYYNDQLYIHLNFGWSGSDDAWYTPADFDTGAIINASSYNFTNIHTTVFNIFTNATQYSVIASGRVLDQDGNAIAGAAVTAKCNTTNVTATSDSRGVYALILPPTDSTSTYCNYTVNATHAEYTSVGALTVRASRTVGDDPVKSGNNYTGSYYNRASNSNSYDNDITMEALDLPKVATPESATAAEFETSASVALTCATNGAAIYYTLDGTAPSESSTLYSAPFTITKTTTVRARAFKSGHARSDVFTRTFVSAAAIDEYYFRHDFSNGTKVFIAGEGTNFTRDQTSSNDSNAKAVDGPNGPGTAHHPGQVWGQFEQPTVLHGAWSAAMSLCMDDTENGILVSFGRLNTTDQKEVALLSSSTKSNLYFKVMTTDSNKAKSVENTFTVPAGVDLTDGFHSLVVTYTPASEILNGAGSFDIYCDGVLAGTCETTTTKFLGKDVGGMQYCMLMSGGSDLAALGAVSSTANDEVAFYDFRFFDRALTASEVTKYATAYPAPAVSGVIEAWGADRYVQNGLIAHFDGLENTASGAQHSDTASQWSSIGGTASGLKFSFSGRNSSVGSWRPDGRYFDGNAKGETSANITLGNVWTVQATTTMDTSKQLTSKTTPKSQYPIVFAADGDSISAYLNNNGSTTTKLIFKNDSYSGLSSSTRASIATFGGKYLTAAFDRTNTKKTYFTQDTALGSGTSNGSTTATVPSLKYWIGGTDDNHYVKGTMHALRIYGRLLTDEEIAQNRAVDEVRFRGDGVVVYSNTDGVMGVESNAFYRVEGGCYEFSAPAETDVDGTTWQCVGFELDKYNSASDTWASDGNDHQGEFRYSYDSATGGRVRLKWLWTKKRLGYAWTGAAGDGKFSTLANWANLADGTAAEELPTPGQILSFSAAAGGVITNDVVGLGGADIVFPAMAGQYTIAGNGFTNVANVINESASVQTLSNAVFFVDTYNVAVENAVNFAGGATATTAGTVTGAVGKTLTGDITFTGDWDMNASYTVPSGSRVAAQNVTGGGAALTIDQGGYAHFAYIQPGKNDTVWRINLNVNGTLEVDGNVDYWNSGSGGSVQAVSSSAGTGVIIAKGFYKHGGKQHLCTIKNLKIGAGSASSSPIFGATYGSNMLHFFQDITIKAMADIEFQSVYNSSMPKENGGISLHAGKTMTINTEDDDGNPHTVTWGCSFCVKTGSVGGSWGYSDGNVRLSKQGKGTLIMRNRCSITGSTGYVKDYHGYTDVRGGTLRVEEKGQLGSSGLTVYGGARFELANSVALPNNTTLTGGGNCIDIGNSASLKLTSSSGDNATITMGTGATLTGSVTLGTNATVAVGNNATITGNVVLGTNSTMTAGANSTVTGNVTVAAFSAVTFGAGSTIASLTMDENAAFKPADTGYLNVTESFSGTIKLDLSGFDLSRVNKIPLFKVPEALKGTAESAIDRSSIPYGWSLRAKEDDGSVYYDIRKNALSIMLR